MEDAGIFTYTLKPKKMIENLRLCKIDGDDFEDEVFYFHFWEERAEKHWHPENPSGDMFTKYHVAVVENVKTGRIWTSASNDIIFLPANTNQ